MTKPMPPKNTFHIVEESGHKYEYDEETLKRYMRSSAKRKLNLLEEVNQLTNASLTEKEKFFHDKIRRGRRIFAVKRTFVREQKNA